MKIYIVTVGYEQCIDQVFSTKELAQEYCDLFRDTNEYEEWEIDKFNNFSKFKGKNYYLTIVDLGGNLISTKIVDASPCDDPTQYCWYNETRDYTTKVTTGDCVCWADDEQQALKITSEKRAEYISTGKRDYDTERYKYQDSLPSLGSFTPVFLCEGSCSGNSLLNVSGGFLFKKETE